MSEKDSWIRIGIDLGGTKTAAIVLNNAGQTLAQAHEATPRTSYADLIAFLGRMVRDLETQSAATAEAVRVGVSMPGSIILNSGRVQNANLTLLNQHTFPADLAETLQRSVRTSNDANCLAVSEATDGAAEKEHCVFAVILGTGTGGGIAFQGRPLIGVQALAGEWGHNPLPWPNDTERPGPRCYCGKHGCLETYLSGPGLAADHQAVNGHTLSTYEIVAAAQNGAAAAEATLQRYEDRLARGLATVVNLIDPQVIVLGGGLSSLERLYKSVPLLLERYIFSTQPLATRLYPAKHGPASGVRGAAWLWPMDAGSATAVADPGASTFHGAEAHPRTMRSC